MSVRLSTNDWWLVAFAAPLAGWLFLLPNAAVKG